MLLSSRPPTGIIPAITTLPPRWWRRHRGAAIAALAVGLFLIASSPRLHAGLLGLVFAGQAIIVRYPVLGPTVFVLLSALSAMLAFLSSAALVPVAVQVWGAERSIVLLWIGWMLGGLASYGIARGLGRPIVRRLGPERALTEHARQITRHVPFGVVLLFQLALPSEVPGYVLGLAGYPVLKYLAALALVELPYAIGTVLMGAGFLARRLEWIVALTAAAVLTAVLSIRALRRRWPASSRETS
jgi:uncharacterized membrane protein YdjX (TVP38/TMEM64 family)